MKKNKIVAVVISVIVGCLVLFFGLHSVFKDGEKIALFSCKHSDKDIDLICDLCGKELSFKDYSTYKELKESISEVEDVLVTGNMFFDTSLEAKKLESENSINLAKLYIPTLADEDIIAGYDISMYSQNNEFEPKSYGEEVSVNISGLDILGRENLAMLHIFGNTSYEIIPLTDYKYDFVEFNAESFSTYILVALGTHNYSFSCKGEVTILDQYGNQINNNETTLDGGSDFVFSVVAGEGYELKSVTLQDIESAVLLTKGDAYGMTCIAKDIVSDFTINVEAQKLPNIVSNPENQKVKEGESVTFEVGFDNAKKVLWQYKDLEEDVWKLASGTLGSSYMLQSSSIITINSVSEDISGYELRALLYNEADSIKPTISESALILTMQDILSTEIKSTVMPEVPVIITSRASGVWGNTDVSFEIVAGGNLIGNQSFQYKIGDDGEWIDYQNKEVVSTEGTTKIYARAINADIPTYISDETSAIIMIDKQVPYADTISTTESLVKFTANDDLSGVASWAVTSSTEMPTAKSLDTSVSGDVLGTWYSVSSIASPMDLTFNGLTLGTYYIWLKDNAGNVSDPKSFMIYRDIMAPIGSLKIVGNEVQGITYVNSTNVKLIISASDNVTSKENLKMKVLNKDEFNNIRSLSEIEWEDFKSEVNWQIPSNDGPKRVYLLLKDEAGNVSLTL